MKGIVILLAAVYAAFSTVGIDHGADADAVMQTQDTLALGRLCFVNLKEGEQPVMTALSLFGNRCGSESFNNKPCAAEGIRSVFELDEWIEFHPQAQAGSGIKVMVFTHKADRGFYLENALDDETPGYVLSCELNRDPDDENYNWGSFYLHPEEVDPGFYDFVFLFDGKVFATMLTYFFDKDEIADKSDSELEELMTQSAF